jgi:hypothetical protein
MAGGVAAKLRLRRTVQHVAPAHLHRPPPAPVTPPAAHLLGPAELAQRGVSDHSCFSVPPSATVDELMAQPGSQDLDPEKAAAVEPIFNMDAPCVRNFDHAKFQRDGFWVWDSIWLPGARAKLIAASHRVQALNDEYLRGGDIGWENVDWGALGLKPPQRYWTAEEIDAKTGGGQLGPHPPGLPGGYHIPATGSRYPILQGYAPETLPAGYDPYIGCSA